MWDQIVNLWNLLSNQLGHWELMDNPAFIRLAHSSVIVLLLLLLRFFLYRVVHRRVQDVRGNYLWRRTINYSTSILALLLILPLWLDAFANVGTFLGLMTAGVAIALQDPLVNLAGWLFIMARRPFAVGDRVEIDGIRGDVIDIRLFLTHLLECGNWVDADQATGRVVVVPNGRVFKSPVANYTRDFHHIWDELPVLVTFESDWRKAKELLTQIADEHAAPLSAGAHEQIRRAGQRKMIFFSKLTPIVYTSVKDSGVMLTLRYLTHPRQRRINQEKLWEAILDAFGEAGRIDFAYPTMRYYQNQVEGKPPMRAAS